ncbi:TetR/AcrR family transcriptional regulator [Rhizobium leguminosarum]|uniref:TetR/AcrR family transcriptional regulator n=1 Tax=Rhizobium leguminosarum TaxID=384 RepID=A0A444I3G4_RHILE|nr:TetR/AcrR family transcriptional regulator [Rhizobium leguminosarum]
MVNGANQCPRRSKPYLVPVNSPGYPLVSVLEHALVLLANGGKKSLTTARLAKAARCSKESIYKWFGNREQLLTAMVSYQTDRAERAVRSFIYLHAPDNNPLEAVDLVGSVARHQPAYSESNRNPM